MNPLMSEERIAQLIDQAVVYRKRLNDGESKFLSVLLKVGHKQREFSDLASWRMISKGMGTLEDLQVVLFDLSLRSFYISNIKPYGWNVLRVSLKMGQYGRDANFGVDTIDKLVSVLAKDASAER